MSSTNGDQLERLALEAEAAWQELNDRVEAGSGGVVGALLHADYRTAVPVLTALRPLATSFLEFGSGVGGMTILADLLGFEAAGIEHDGWLCDRARELAESFASKAQFAEGSYVPDALRDSTTWSDPDFHTVLDAEPGYAELGAELDEFDLIYAYSWPGEEEFVHEIVRSCARSGALFLTYGSVEGYRLFRDGVNQEWN